LTPLSRWHSLVCPTESVEVFSDEILIAQEC
jgi:hypothetical protein